MTQKRTQESTAVITGAGTGIGRATAVMLASRGWRLALAGRRQEPLEETARLCSDAHTQAKPLVIPTDVADPEQARRLITTTVKQLGRLDALVNNAGSAPTMPIEQTDPQTLHRVFAINAFGSAYTTIAAWNVFQEHRGGCIVNVSSVAAADPLPGLFAYAGAKAAVESFARSCANEGRAHNLRAFTVAPGAVDTDMLREVLDEQTISQINLLSPEQIGEVIVGCIEGAYDDRIGGTIAVPNPS